MVQVEKALSGDQAVPQIQGMSNPSLQQAITHGTTWGEVSVMCFLTENDDSVPDAKDVSPGAGAWHFLTGYMSPKTSFCFEQGKLM